jgi:hypothetical protein
VIRVEEKTGAADTLSERMSSAFSDGLEDLKDNAEDFMVWISYNVFGLVGWIVVITVAVVLIRKKKWSMPRIRIRKEKNPEEK